MAVISSVDNNAKELLRHGDQLFSKRLTLMSLWQSLAEQFYPERADFTVNRTLGDEFADNLMTSYPLMARRDLGNSFSTMLRPTAKDWFHMRASREEYEDQPAKAWLEQKTGVMKRAMYDRKALFTRATKEGDHDFAAFGQGVLSVELNRNADGLLYRCWHLRDVAWCEDAEGKVGAVHRKWRPAARELLKMFPGKCSAKVSQLATRQPYAEVNVRHCVVKSEDYEGQWKTPYVSIYLDADNQHVIEAVGVWNPIYVIPRWQTVSGSQYAYSPATVAALPDARLLQAMTRVLLEAGEKATNPPMVAVQEAIRSDVAIYAGGITWVDAEYDEKLGEVLRPLTQDKTGLNFGADQARDTRAMISEAFFLNKLTLPQNGPEMTAYEVGQRVQDFIRATTPLFEPVEQDYNGALCEVTFDLLLRAGAFGSAADIPQSIRGADIEFRFESPLHDAIELQKGNTYREVRVMLAETMEVDPSVAANVDMQVAFRDALTGIGTPAKWLRSENDAAEIIEAQAQEAAARQAAQDVAGAAQVAQEVGAADQALAA